MKPSDHLFSLYYAFRTTGTSSVLRFNFRRGGAQARARSNHGAGRASSDAAGPRFDWAQSINPEARKRLELPAFSFGRPWIGMAAS